MALFARFRGGVHPPENKGTAAVATQPLPRPERLVLPLRQHIGAPCKPLVAAGAQVQAGQPVGDTDAPVAAPIHASLSGKVSAVEPRLSPSGRMEMSVVIDVAPEDEWWPDLPAGLGWGVDPAALEPATLRTRIRQAGLVGLGGAGFPTAVKLSAEADVVLLNGAECEPVLTSDHRLMLEEPEKVVLGLRLLMQACGAKRGVIALEANKADAAAALTRCVKGDPALKVEVLPVRYPQGAEKMLIWGALRRAVPVGALPIHVGVVVQNVSTAAAVATALAEGRPLTERIVTVAGKVQRPGNFRAPIGAGFVDLIAAAGGENGSIAKVVAGGPMMGAAQMSLTVPVTKTTGGIILLGPEDLTTAPETVCIRCGRCVSACPMGLLPAKLAEMAEAGRWEDAEKFYVAACMECGSCSYACPAHRPLVQQIRLTKSELAKVKAARQGGVK
ncbi:MAG TPA: electron transport complex subunit RsxC [Symbiobacteriaceae bacterium]|nr:electron transport complex subunit RsxC [Symbiobacteriaceae bacterium]